MVVYRLLFLMFHVTRIGTVHILRSKITIEKFFENATTYIDIDKSDIIELRAGEIMKIDVSNL